MFSNRRNSSSSLLSSSPCVGITSTPVFMSFNKRRKLSGFELLESFKEVLEYVLPKHLVVESPTLLEKPVRDNNVENQKVKLLNPS